MPQATSAQREPSMEEILASIRRIIEDSDSSKKHPSDSEVQPMKAAEPPVVKAEVEAFRAELRKPPEPFAPKLEPVAARPTAVEERKPVSLADVQAEMKRTLPEAPRPLTPTAHAPKPLTPAANMPKPVNLAEVKASMAEETAPHVEPPVAETERRPVSMAEIHAMLDRQTDAKPAPMAEPVAQEPQMSRAEAATPAPPADVVKPVELDIARPNSVLPVEPFPAAANAPKPAEPAVEASQPKSIISAAAGRQVAAAFGELSEAFAASRQKSFDQMAEDMMRPMLQEWMDNNLPILVERLVREEIERVARGV